MIDYTGAYDALSVHRHPNHPRICPGGCGNIFALLNAAISCVVYASVILFFIFARLFTSSWSGCPAAKATFACQPVGASASTDAEGMVVFNIKPPLFLRLSGLQDMRRLNCTWAGHVPCLSDVITSGPGAIYAGTKHTGQLCACRADKCPGYSANVKRVWW